ncbi:hypothetical protein [Micromonospora sp. ATCC 39149]|uniref:Uncharacterized protein n=1 Tax=Micromonospora carbonacea TaxID=47853 RepID=A0A7D6C867_9ACTN|nr:hypothetical protein [Micromonospora sp. ATCC 39149]QLK00487.1 hypothetical protein HZU44_10865 [Micromonospora carbonacea]
MSEFQMPASPDVAELLNAIACEMVDQFGITRAEAVARINEQWHRQDLSSNDEIILHEDEYFWALFIYFGGEVPNWSRDANRSEWIPKPVPTRDSGYWPMPD